MKAELIKKENGEATFTMEYTAEEFDDAQVEVYKRTKENYKVDGFRDGKAPRSIIEKRYGETVFIEDAINDLFRIGYPQALKDLDLEVVDQARVEMGKIAKGQPLKATFTVAIYPEIEVKDYKGVEVDRKHAELEEGDLEKTIEEMRERNARIVDVDRQVKDGDHIVLDYKGFVGDEQFEGGTAEGHGLVIGSGQFIPGFEDQLVGANKDEDLDVKVTFPEEYHAKDLAGKEAIFKCKVREVKEKQLPEYDDEFVKDISEFDTVEEFEKDIEEKLLQAKEDMAVEAMKDEIIGEVFEANDIDVPEGLVLEEVDVMIREMANQLQQQGMGIEMYLEYIGKTMADLREEVKGEAGKRVKTRMILRAIADQEGIEATDEEVDLELDKMASIYKMDKEKLLDLLNDEAKDMMKKDLAMKKTIDFLYDEAKIKEGK